MNHFQHMIRSGLCLALLMGLTGSLQAETRAFSKGVYREPLLRFDCARDLKQYGQSYEGEYEPATHYCGQDVPAGYWVYQAPRWTIYRHLTRPAPLDEARMGGKYKKLVLTVNCPAEREQEEQSLGRFSDYGWDDANQYCGKAVPAGYWVWVAPNWYLWQNKDISAIGFASQEISVPLQQALPIKMEFAQQNKAWANTTLKNFSRGVLMLEAWSKTSFPGQRPYLVEERPNYELLGSANRHKMALASPPRGTPWTLYHEMIHIWNVNVTPAWFNEGQANFISYLLVKDAKLPFSEPETWPVYQKAWENIRGTSEDLPLQDNYDQLPQGKAMAFWRLLYELGGPDLIREAFVYSVQNGTVSMPAFKRILDKHLGRLPLSSQQILSGWVLPGRYHLFEAKELGPVRFPLP